MKAWLSLAREVINETLMALQMTGEKTATASSHSQPERGKKVSKTTNTNKRPGMAVIPHLHYLE